MMKFFTQCTGHKFRAKLDDAAQWRKVLQSYREHLERMRTILPASVIELAELSGVDDGLIVEVRHDKAQEVLTLVLRCGHLQMGYYDLVLTYEGASLSPPDAYVLARLARLTKNDGRWNDLDCHEVGVTEDGRIEHRIMFHTNHAFAIQCQNLRWEKIDRPNRELPDLSDRFPGGPVTTFLRRRGKWGFQRS